jgi:hypothetical protein
MQHFGSETPYKFVSWKTDNDVWKLCILVGVANISEERIMYSLKTCLIMMYVYFKIVYVY